MSLVIISSWSDWSLRLMLPAEEALPAPSLCALSPLTSKLSELDLRSDGCLRIAAANEAKRRISDERSFIVAVIDNDEIQDKLRASS